MFDFIIGNVSSINDTSVVLNCGNIGYILNSSSYTISKCRIDETVKLFTYLQVREDALTLFGFFSVDERNMFLRLLTVSGVGPKMAMSIVGGMTLSDLALCILKSDIKSLSSIKGLGKKTAERIVLELREKISITETFDSSLNEKAPELNEQANEAIVILMSLGLNKNEALRRVKIAIDKGIVDSEAILNAALRG